MRRAFGAGVLGAVVALAACGTPEKQDAHQTRGAAVDRSPAEKVLAMPDSFSNIAIKCDGFGHRVYVTSHGDVNRPSQIQVIDDPTCGQ